MSKYFVKPIEPKPAPTATENIINAILDIEKRLDALEDSRK